MSNHLVLAIVASVVASGALASPAKEVKVGRGSACNNGFQWLILKNQNRNKTIVANVEITQRGSANTDVYQRQYVVPPGGTTEMICSGSHGTSAGGAYTATARLLGAQYQD